MFISYSYAYSKGIFMSIHYVTDIARMQWITSGTHCSHLADGEDRQWQNDTNKYETEIILNATMEKYKSLENEI